MDYQHYKRTLLFFGKKYSTFPRSGITHNTDSSEPILCGQIIETEIRVRLLLKNEAVTIVINASELTSCKTDSFLWAPFSVDRL